MDVQPLKRIFGGASGFVLETLVLWVAFVATAMLLHSRLGLLITGAMALLHLYLGTRGKRAAGVQARTTLRAVAFLCLQGVAVALAVLAMTMPPTIGWLLWAFPELGRSIPGPPYLQSIAGVLWLMVGLSTGSLALFAVSPLMLRRSDERIDAVYRRFLADALRVNEPTVAALALTLAILGLITMGTAAVAYGEIIDMMTPYRTLPLAWELAVALPVLPMGFVAAAVLMVICRRLCGYSSTAPERQDAAPAMPRPGWIAAGVGMLASGAVIGGATGYFLHIGLVGALGAGDQHTPVTMVANGVADWVAEQQEAGRGGGEIAALLQEHGQWMPGTPETGLAVLMPAIKDEKSFDEIEDSACRFTIEAAAADPGALREIGWLTAEDATRPVRYCLAVACPIPTRWRDDVTLWLFSSHTSRNRYWVENRFVDLFGRGAAVPGGYCASTGGLADRFQG